MAHRPTLSDRVGLSVSSWVRLVQREVSFWCRWGVSQGAVAAVQEIGHHRLLRLDEVASIAEAILFVIVVAEYIEQAVGHLVDRHDNSEVCLIGCLGLN